MIERTAQCTVKSQQIIRQLIPFRELMVQLQTHFASHAKLRQRVDTGVCVCASPRVCCLLCCVSEQRIVSHVLRLSFCLSALVCVCVCVCV